MLEKIALPSGLRAVLISVVNVGLEGHETLEDTMNSMMELRELLRTLEVEPTEEIIQPRKKLEAATIIGKGKLEEITKIAKEKDATVLVFDVELTATQARNIKEATKMEVIDRCSVILEIFAKHARTSEAKIQIEISRLQYLLPRLSIMWTHFSRQKGGVGVRGGEGEQQIELDRRMIRDRIEFYKKQLESVVVSRQEQKKKRKNNVVLAALVGYTNVGKSSLMNRLCKVNVLEENKLFATLDATYRTLNPDSRPPMVLIDTVGLISNLPTTLVSGFKTTLESAMEADLLIIVSDISHKNIDRHLEVTENILKELGAEEKERIYVFNKKDLIKDEREAKIIMRSYKNAYLVSTQDTADMTSLRKSIIEFFLSKQDYYDLFVPYSEGEAHASILARTNVMKSINHEEGIFYRIRIPKNMFENLGLRSFVLSPHAHREIVAKLEGP